MKVIFTDDVKSVASAGDAKNVKDGFFRNYLLPRKKAVIATEHLLKQWEQRRKKLLIAKEQLHAKFKEAKQRLEGAVLKIAKKVTKKGTLYGGVKPADIAKEIQEQLNIEIQPSAVIIDQPIKTVGKFDIKLDFGEGIMANVSVEVEEKS